jgi:hypothetical protein
VGTKSRGVELSLIIIIVFMCCFGDFVGDCVDLHLAAQTKRGLKLTKFYPPNSNLSVI